MRLWFKIMRDDRMVYNRLEENDCELCLEDYESMLTEMCHHANLSTPVTLRSHYVSLVQFNVTYYLPRDFMESVDFDRVIIENVDKE